MTVHNPIIATAKSESYGTVETADSSTTISSSDSFVPVLERSRSSRWNVNKGTEGHVRWKELNFIYAAIVADGIASNILYAYGTIYVRDTFHIQDVAFYSGILLGIFSLTVAISAPFLGWLSDMIGRRYLLIMGLMSVAIFCLIGGMVGNFWVSVAMQG